MVRFKSILFLTIILLAILLSGCVGEKPNSTIPKPTTPVVTATVTATPLITPIPDVIPTGNEIQIKLDSRRGFIPDVQTINVGDEVVWDNFDSVPVTLISNDGLFDARQLAFYQQYRYIFKEPGIYGFTLENRNLNGTIIVEFMPVQTPPSITIPGELPFNALFVTARIKKLSNWSSGNEIKYGLDLLKVDIVNQINIPLSIKAQILNGDQILEERSFDLAKEGSIVEFTNENRHFINNTNVTLRLLVQGYKPIDYNFTEVDQLN